MPTLSVTCFNCSEKMEFVDFVSRREECPKCGEDVRVCKNCEFYDPKSYNECRETSADPIQEKHRSNLCEYFRPGGGDGAGKNSADELKAAAEALFKK